MGFNVVLPPADAKPVAKGDAPLISVPFLLLRVATAGGAFVNMQTVVNGVTSTKDQAGWTAGAGIEWAFADNWTAKVEYLFVDVGSGTVNCSTGPCVLAYGAPIPVSVSLTENLIRAGINFKFNGW